MKKALCILLACIIIIGGCSIQSTTPDAGEPAAMEEKETQETDESYPGHVPMGTVIACAEAWLEKEQGLTPFADIDKAELTWLDGSFIQQYKIDVIGKKLKNGDVNIIMSSDDLGDDAKRFEEFLKENLQSYADDLSAKLDLNIDTQYTRIVISKDHMDTILNAVLSAETDCWPD